jgi:hypothetical protein
MKASSSYLTLLLMFMFFVWWLTKINFFFGPSGNPGEQSGPHDVDIVILVSCMHLQVLVASRRHCGGNMCPTYGGTRKSDSEHRHWSQVNFIECIELLS